MLNILNFVSICFFISGFTALSYELTWTRLLKQVFGSSNLAVSTMLTVFIGGLALGAYLAGKHIDKIAKLNKDKNLLLSYGYIEFAIAIYAFLVPFLFSDMLLAPIWKVLLSDFGTGSLISYFIRFAFSLVLLIIPTCLMGATFPVLSEYLNRQKLPAESTGRLYAINTAGSIFGVLFSGFVFLPNLGLNQTIQLSSTLNILIFLAVYFACSKRKSFISFVFEQIQKLSPNKTKQSLIDSAQEFKSILSYKHILAIVFTTGFIALGLEVIWTKLLTLILGSSTYAFTIILASFLTGISLGAFALNANIERIKKPVNFIIWALLALVIAIFLSSLSFNELPWIFLKLTHLLPAKEGLMWWALLNSCRFLLSALIMLPVAFITGAIFTLVLNLYSIADKGKSVAKQVSQIYYINTLGSILGSSLVGFVLIPFFNQFASGMQLSTQFLMSLTIVLLLAIFLKSKEEEGITNNKSRIIKTSSLAVLSIVSIFIFSPSWKAGAMASGVAIYHGATYKDISRRQYEQLSNIPVLFHKEGLNNVVTVTQNKNANTIYLKNNGKNEAGVPIRTNRPSKADMVTQILLAEIPLLIHNKKPEQVLVIGMGGGTTVGSALKSKEVKQLDICELEAAVIEAQKFFEPKKKKNPLSANGSPLNIERNPQASKVQVHATDGRNHLLSSKKQYDIIISQPSDPWISGSGNLYTKEFWQLSAKKLNQDGLFVQWVQLFSISPELLATILNTFQAAFPEVLAFRPGETGELILVGAQEKVKLDIDQINERINTEFSHLVKSKKLKYSPKDDLARISISNARDLLANLLLETQGIKKFIEKYSGKINTDDNMLVEFSISKKSTDFNDSLDKNIEALLDFAVAKDISKWIESASSQSRFLAALASKHHEMARGADKSNYQKNIHGKLALAFAELAAEINQSPTSFLPFVEIFHSINKFDEYKSFIKKAQNAKTMKPDSEHYLALAQLSYYDGKLKQAISQIQKSINLDPANYMAFIKKGLFYYELYKYKKSQAAGYLELKLTLDQSLAAYTTAAKLDKVRREAWAGIGNVEFAKAVSLKQNDSIKKSVKAYKRAIKTDLHFWPSYLNLGKLYTTMGYKYSHKAVKALKDTLMLNPTVMEAHYHLAEIEYNQGSLDKAYKHLSKVVRFCETREGHVKEVSTFCSGPGGIQAHQLRKAKVQFDKLTKLIKGIPLVEDSRTPVILN